MEKGTLRVDANVSVRPAGEDGFRTRTEIKNINSFSFVARGIEAEVERQIAVWESGGEVEQATFDFDASTGTLTSRRTKEEAEDYRYFPEPDLVPIEPSAELIERLRAELPELPGERIQRLEPALGFALAGRRRHERPRPRCTRRSSATSSTRARSANFLMNEGRELEDVPNAGRASEGCSKARREIPRERFHEGGRGERESGRSRPSRISQRPGRERRLRAGAADRRRSSPRTRPRSRPTAAARRGCSASSSAR